MCNLETNRKMKALLRRIEIKTDNLFRRILLLLLLFTNKYNKIKNKFTSFVRV